MAQEHIVYHPEIFQVVLHPSRIPRASLVHVYSHCKDIMEKIIYTNSKASKYIEKYFIGVKSETMQRF